MSRNPGLPEHGGGAEGFHRLEGSESDVRRNAALLAVGIAITALLFLVLPFMQVVSQPNRPTVIIEDSIALTPPKLFELPPPPPVPDKPVEKPDDLKPEFNPIPYEQLFANPSPTGTLPFPDVTIRSEDIPTGIVDYLDLDRVPTVIHTVAPDVPRSARAAGTVVIEFIVTDRGQVTGIKIVSSTDRIFETPAATAVAKWRFEPGVKNNAPVSTRMRLPIRFNVAN